MARGALVDNANGLQEGRMVTKALSNQVSAKGMRTWRLTLVHAWEGQR